MSKKTRNLSRFKKAELAGGLLLLAIFVVPFLTMAGHKDIYVDDDASGKQDGSAGHPYKTINDALGISRSGDKIHVAKGEYKENIHLRDGRELYGESRDDVVIKADDNDYEVVNMDNDTVLDKVTVKGGRYGVRVGKNERASIVNCVIKDNDDHGVLLEESKTDDKYKVSITDSVIKDNGWKGIYSAKRRLVLIDNEIADNKNDGAEIEAGSRVWMEDNKFQDNGASGLKLTLDGAYIWAEDNSFSDNKREGIEVNSYGETGTIDIKNSKIHGNDRWGIARVQRNSFNSNAWSGLILHSGVAIYENGLGSISNIVFIK